MLEVENLCVTLQSRDRPVLAVRNVSLQIKAGEAVGLVGESGCGKSRTALSLLGLHDSTARVSGRISLDGELLLDDGKNRLTAQRGKHIAMIFQDALSALNPYLRIKTQMLEGLRHHAGVHSKAALQRAIELLHAVKLPEPEYCLRAYPHQLSGGMRQRVMIAMALMCEPKILVADEPTTALDVTVQAEVVQLLDALREQMNLGLLFITHDIGLVSQFCDRVLVMYAGEVVESASTAELFRNPRHPYSRALLNCAPRLETPRGQLSIIDGHPPVMTAAPSACPFAPRCPSCFDACLRAAPTLRGDSQQHAAACFLEDRQ